LEQSHLFPSGRFSERPGSAPDRSTNACAFRLRPSAFGFLSDFGFRISVFLALFVLALMATVAAPPPQVLQRYHDTQAKHQARLQDATLAWQYGRACFDLAEYATNNTERAELAEQGIAACRQAIAQDSKSAASHYYLGLNLGQLARTRGLSALGLIKEMEGEWITAAGLDRALDYAGPERTLGMLYRDAPSFISVGSRSKARQQLTRAVEIAPHYPENRLELVETYLKWKDRAAARRELQALEKVLPAARREFSGVAWKDNWRDWDSRLETLKKQAAESEKIQTPRH